MSIRTTLKIYHRDNGSNELVKKIEALAKDHNIAIETFDIIQDKFTATRLLQLCNKMKLTLEEIADTESEFYKKNLTKVKLDDADWVRLLIENPNIIRVPIVETEEVAKIITNPRDILSISPIGQNIKRK